MPRQAPHGPPVAEQGRLHIHHECSALHAEQTGGDDVRRAGGDDTCRRLHGLAFAALIGRLGLGPGSLLADLAGFNLGIELTQLLVVALLRPSLLLLSRTRAYPAVRVALAGAGIVLAAAWLAERTTPIAANPLNAVSDRLVEHPFLVAVTVAATAATAWATPRLRAIDSTPRPAARRPPPAARTSINRSRVRS